MVASAWKIDMKKAFITFLLVLATCISAWAGDHSRVESLVSQYKGHEGFEVVSMGRLGMSLIRGAVRISGDLDAEDRAALRVFSDIKKLVIVDFEDADPLVRAQFTRKLEKVLNKMELVIEVKDDGETFQVFGKESGNRIKDCVLYCSDGALIYTVGSIDIDKVGRLIEVSQ